jgi:hypothetical protein
MGRFASSPFSRWSAPLNTAIPPEFLVKSAHIYGDSARNCSGSGAPGIVRRVSSYLHLLNIRFLGISLNLGPKISHTLLVSEYDMSVVLVATHQHVMTDKWTNVMILSGTINTRRRLVNVTLSSRHTFLLRDVICYPDRLCVIHRK